MEEWNMGLSRRKFTREFKQDAMERLESGASVAAVARALEVNPGLLQRWRQDPDRVAQLERKIGQQTLEIDFLKGCLQRIEQQRQLQAVIGMPLSTAKSKTRETERQP
jgi:transposase